MTTTAMPASYGDVGALGASTWETVIDAIATRGMEFRRDPYPIALYVGLGLLLIAVFSTPILTRARTDPPLEALVLGALGIAGLMVIARIVDIVTARRLILRDDGIESYRGIQRLSRVPWRNLARAGLPPIVVSPLVGRPGEVIWLPSSFTGRDFLAECVAWSFDNRAEIVANGGSLTRALHTMAQRDGVSFSFDWWSSIVGTAVLGGITAGIIAIAILDETPFAQRSLVTVGLFVLMLGFAVVLAATVYSWTDISTRVVVSSRGVTTIKNGKTIDALTWDEIVQPDALKQRRDLMALACDASGKKVISSANMRGSEFLNAIVDHFLVGELRRRDLLKTLTPTDIWGKLDE